MVCVGCEGGNARTPQLLLWFLVKGVVRQAWSSVLHVSVGYVGGWVGGWVGVRPPSLPGVMVRYGWSPCAEHRASTTTYANMLLHKGAVNIFIFLRFLLTENGFCMNPLFHPFLILLCQVLPGGGWGHLSVCGYAKILGGWVPELTPKPCFRPKIFSPSDEHVQQFKVCYCCTRKFYAMLCLEMPLHPPPPRETVGDHLPPMETVAH